MVACTYSGEMTDVRKPSINPVEVTTASRGSSVYPGGASQNSLVSDLIS